MPLIDVTIATDWVSSGNGLPTGANVVYEPAIVLLFGVDGLVPGPGAVVVAHEADPLAVALAADAAAVADARARARQRVAAVQFADHRVRRRGLAERLRS